MFLNTTILVFLMATMLSVCYPTEEIDATAGFDLHARLWKKIIKAQTQAISTGGYLTDKFQELVFQPAVDLISFEVRKLMDELKNQGQRDIIEVASISVSLLSILVIAFFYQVYAYRI